jgi:hypothetical protein
MLLASDWHGAWAKSGVFNLASQSHDIYIRAFPFVL